MRADGIYKIIDLGFGRELVSSDQVDNFTLLGTDYTMAPEVRNGQSYGVKVSYRSTQADIYSIGIIFLRMVVANIPYHQRDPEHFQQITCRNKQGRLLNPAIVDLISKMTGEDQCQRIGWEQLLLHPVFSNQQHITESRLRRLVEDNFEDIKKKSTIIISHFEESVRLQ